MVKDKPQETVEQREINLLVDFREDRLHHDVALALARLPDIGQVVDTLTPLVDEKRRWLRVGGLDPRGEQTTLVGLEEQELVEVLELTCQQGNFKSTKRTTYSIRDLLYRLDVVARNELVIRVEELDTRLLEGTLGEQETLDTRQTLVRVVVGLLNQCQLLTLRLI